MLPLRSSILIMRIKYTLQLPGYVAGFGYLPFFNPDEVEHI
jgi:hypothetical protein